MKKNPLVSIIIPVYNGSDYVKDAIFSALNQTYQNIEIIVVNDGSSDKTEEICLSFGEKIRYFKKENGGVSTALNVALKEMKGEYFSWLSHDDLYYKNKIEEEVNALEENTIILSDYDLIDENSNKITDVILPNHVIKMHYEYALLKCFINGITLLIPKKAFDICGEFNPELKCTQDYDMWFRMLLKKFKFKHVPKILASSRQHRMQTTNTSSKVISEGNQLWINIMERLQENLKVNISGSVYNFYREMFYFLNKSPYKEASNFASKMKNKLYSTLDIDNIKVSIILPLIDNNFENIKKTIFSVLKQTHKNFELIIVNSTLLVNDDIKEISNDERIIFLENTNKNISLLRNMGISSSSGDYIAFLNSGDEFMLDKLEVQLRELILCNKSFSHTAFVLEEKSKEINNIEVANGYVYRECIKEPLINISTMLVKKSIIVENEISFDENIEYGEDICFCLNLLLKDEIIGINIPLSKVNRNVLERDKEIVKVKNVLKHVLNTKVLNSCDREIAYLCKSFNELLYLFKSNNYEYEYNQVVNSKSWKITKPFRLLCKVFRSLKEAGFKQTIYKVKRYLNN